VSDVLWACLNMFSGSTYTLATKTLLVFPWNDNPHDGELLNTLWCTFLQSNVL